MNITLPSGKELRGDSIIDWVLRSDLAPVMRTVEFTVRLSEDLESQLAEGNVIRTGWEFFEYQIIKTEKRNPVGVVQGKDSLQALHVTALLKPCVSIASRSKRAVVIEGGDLRQVYASCGAKFPFSSDIAVKQFSCFKGQVPSFAIAKLFQEQQISLICTGEKGKPKLGAVRLRDLFRQEPKHTIGQTDSTGKVESIFLEDNEIPSFFSVADDGSFVLGDMRESSPVHYQPRSSENILRNMSTVLVRRRIIQTRLSEMVNAGDVIAVGKLKLVVSTAAHTMKHQDGSIEVSSRFWCSELV